MGQDSTKKIAHIVFDFDGVIADTYDINWALSQDHDPEATEEDFLAHHDGNVYEEPRIKFHPDRVKDFFTEYSKRLTQSHIASALEPIKRLSSRYRLYVISSSSEDAIHVVLDAGGVRPLFSRIMGFETHPSKVEKFTILMREEGVTADNTVFITDTLGDIREAQKVGIPVIAETFGFHDRARLELGNPYAIVDTWDEIEKEIAVLSSQVLP